MKRLRERLAMGSPVKLQNSIIRRVMADLEKIGDIDYTELKKGREFQFVISSCSPKLQSLPGH
ncbi:hypothetical protein ACCY16_20195 [Candidatus Pantoea formicae]|uniref:hypothetical protein n=1 Tax=Candidatus Pantoea formicae TaxID=2608355 RepID=UPI003EDAABDD